jgi:hypothetical protein
MDFTMGTLLQEKMNSKGIAMYGEEIGHSRGAGHIVSPRAASGILPLLLLGALWCGCSREAHDVLPPRLAGAILARRLEGEEARAIVNRLHGKGVAPLRSLIGFYGDDAGSAAIVYVSVYSEPGEASGVAARMRDGILRGGSVFGAYTEYEVAGRRIAGCTGTGSQHYFFAAGRGVYWLAAPGGKAFSLAQDLAVRVDASTGP